MSGPSSSPMLPAKPPAVIADNDDSQRGGSPDRSQSLAVSEDLEAASNSRALTTDRDDNIEKQPPPLPDEAPPPLPNEELPNEEVPANTEDDGWEPIWDEKAQAFYFYNRYTQVSQWDNPRIPGAASTGAPAVADNGPPGATTQTQPKKPAAGGYDPAIHGDYDPNADYAKAYETADDELPPGNAVSTDSAAAYAATASFNRFTGKWQSADINPDKFSDENKSKRQMNAFFDVDAAANSHDGRSLKAERSSKKITKAELKAYREKRKEKKEERRRAWLRD